MILVYKGEGVSPLSLKHTVRTLRTFYSNGISFVDYPDLEQVQSFEKASCIVFPGGRDIPYHENISIEGIKNIQSFVSCGGVFIGICAGAYFASSSIEFAKGTNIEVCGERRLKLVPSTAIGPVYGPYVYSGHESAVAATISDGNEVHAVYFNGGCYFKDASAYDLKILSTYENGEAAIVSSRYGDGSVLLSGVHFEYDADYLDSQDFHLQKLIPKLKEYNEARKKLVISLLSAIRVKV